MCACFWSRSCVFYTSRVSSLNTNYRDGWCSLFRLYLATASSCELYVYHFFSSFLLLVVLLRHNNYCCCHSFFLFLFLFASKKNSFVYLFCSKSCVQASEIQKLALSVIEYTVLRCLKRGERIYLKSTRVTTGVLKQATCEILRRFFFSWHTLNGTPLIF